MGSVSRSSRSRAGDEGVLVRDVRVLFVRGHALSRMYVPDGSVFGVLGITPCLDGDLSVKSWLEVNAPRIILGRRAVPSWISSDITLEGPTSYQPVLPQHSWSTALDALPRVPLVELFQLDRLFVSCSFEGLMLALAAFDLDPLWAHSAAEIANEGFLREAALPPLAQFMTRALRGRQRIEVYQAALRVLLAVGPSPDEKYREIFPGHGDSSVRSVSLQEWLRLFGDSSLFRRWEGLLAADLKMLLEAYRRFTGEVRSACSALVSAAVADLSRDPEDTVFRLLIPAEISYDLSLVAALLWEQTHARAILVTYTVGSSDRPSVRHRIFVRDAFPSDGRVREAFWTDDGYVYDPHDFPVEFEPGRLSVVLRQLRNALAQESS